jgi:hypothetical protein
VVRLGIVDLAGSPDEAGMLRDCVNDEPRIDGDAVTAHAGTRAEYVHARVVVRELDEFPDVDSQVVANHGQLVGEGNVDVAERVLDQL